MPRDAGTVIENKFIRGLITETTALNFPTDACTETFNCVFDETGRVTRRLGFEHEPNYVEIEYTPETSEAWSTYEWKTPASLAERSFVVMQQGKTIRFFDSSSSVDLSPNYQSSYDLDMTDYEIDALSSLVEQEVCQYAEGNGNLLITNKYAKPVYVAFDQDSGTLTGTGIDLKYRDFKGLDDGLEINERVSTSLASLKITNPEHAYNIYNQGWYIGDALSQWDSARTDLPSNADAVPYYRSSDTDAFVNSRVTAKDPGNSPAPSGHYILTLGVEDREQALDDQDSITDVSFAGGTAVYPYYQGTNFGDYSGLANLFNNAYVGIQSHTGTTSYAGKQLDTARGIVKVVVYPSPSTPPFSGGWWNGDTDNFSAIDSTIYLYASNSSPANSTDGTLLGTTVFDAFDVTGAQTVTSSDTATTYEYVWATVKRTNNASATSTLSEVTFSYSVAGTGSGETQSLIQPRCIAFFASRAWYAGYDKGGEGGNVYFSQIIDDVDKYGLCYQANDPTSEDLADLLATDGGVIQIPDIGEIQTLFPFQSQLLVFASNGVWLISGGANAIFGATNYSVRRISSIGMSSPQSVVNVKGLPLWWAEDGIYTVTYDANYDSTTVKSLTEETVKTFILAIDPKNRNYVKGTYDRLEDIAYWCYSSDSSLADADVFKYDRFLAFNTKSGAWYPWSIGDPAVTTLDIRGLEYVQDGAREDEYILRFPITYNRSSTDYFTFAGAENTSYSDWEEFATLTTEATDEVDYESYLITGYRVDGEGMKHIQMNYVYTFMDIETNGSCFMQGIFSFTNSSDSGKWSTPQQVYDASTDKGRAHRDVSVTRRKVRGHGKSSQLKFYSETGKPFTLIGWGIFSTANQSI